MSSVVTKRAVGVAAALLVCVLAPLLLIAQQPVPGASANDLVKKAVAQELKDSGRHFHFMYRLTKKTPERNETRECLETDAGTVAKVIAINDQPLTAE